MIRKEPPASDAQQRLRHELAILERLRGVEGVAQLVDAPRYPGSIVLADAGDTTLAGLAEPPAVDDLIEVAVALARAVAGMHRRGVMHRDIAPANIVLSADGVPCLVGFALATTFAELRPEFTHPAEIIGTLAYVAPESTGRTGRPVDQRADMYTLGALLYALASGAPRFGSDDPLRLTHDRLARVPIPPAEVNRALPGRPVSIVFVAAASKLVPPTSCRARGLPGHEALRSGCRERVIQRGSADPEVVSELIGQLSAPAAALDEVVAERHHVNEGSPDRRVGHDRRAEHEHVGCVSDALLL